MTLHMQPTRNVHVHECTKIVLCRRCVPLVPLLVLEPVKKLAGLMTRSGLIYSAGGSTTSREFSGCLATGVRYRRLKAEISELGIKIPDKSFENFGYLVFLIDRLMLRRGYSLQLVI